MTTLESEQQDQMATVKEEDAAAELKSLRQEIACLSEEIAALTMKRGEKRPTQPVCYRCNRPGHSQHDCSSFIQAPTCYTCGHKGHIARNSLGNDKGVSMCLTTCLPIQYMHWAH